jgi:hypothetical protein
MTNPDNTAGTLVRVVGGGAPQPLMDNIVALEFKYYDANMVLISDARLRNTNSGVESISTVEVIMVGQVARPALVNPDAQRQTQHYRIRVRNITSL